MAAKKTRAKTEKSRDDLKRSVQKVWFAGLGAMAVAEEEGSKLFSSLVSKGRQYEKSLNKPVEKARTRVRETVGEMRSRTGKTFSRIEAVLDERMTSALHRVGIPTREEVAALSRKVEQLTRTLKQTKSAPPKTARKKTTGKTSKKAAR